MPPLVDRMMYVTELGPPWHRAGVPVSEAPNLVRAIELADLGKKVEAWPLYIKDPVIGDWLQVPDRVANVRVMDREVLGIVSGRYQIVQEFASFEAMDKAIKELGIELVYETAGSLMDGRIIWVLARLPKGFSLYRNGKVDEQQLYICCSTGHDGVTPTDMFPTTVRVVCYNTLTLAKQERGDTDSDTFGSRFRHSGDVEAKLFNAAAKLKECVLNLKVQQQISEILFETDMYPEDEMMFQSFAVPPLDLKKWTLDVEVADLVGKENRFLNSLALLEDAELTQKKKLEAFATVLEQEKEQWGNTLWSGLNAVTGYYDQAKPGRWKKPGTRLNTLVFGGGGNFSPTKGKNFAFEYATQQVHL